MTKTPHTPHCLQSPVPRVAKVVAPKKAALATAEAEFQELMVSPAHAGIPYVISGQRYTALLGPTDFGQDMTRAEQTPHGTKAHNYNGCPSPSPTKLLRFRWA